MLQAQVASSPDDKGELLTPSGPDGITLLAYKYARQPEWPAAEFIVGNPPFIGKGEPMRAAFGQALSRRAQGSSPRHKQIGGFCLYLVGLRHRRARAQGTVLRRFGFVTTNSITQVFNRRVVERRLNAKKPDFAGPCHPRPPVDQGNPRRCRRPYRHDRRRSRQAPGLLSHVVREARLDTDEPVVVLKSTTGDINSDLTIGADVTSALPLRANERLASMGPALGGRGFVLLPAEVRQIIGSHTAPWLKKLTTGKDITGRHGGHFAIVDGATGRRGGAWPAPTGGPG